VTAGRITSTPQSSAKWGPTSSSCPSPQSEPVGALFARYHAKLVKSLVARTRSWEDARDIASQAFLEVLTQRPGAVSFLGAYLYRTARNLAINRLAHEAMRTRKERLVSFAPDAHPSAEKQSEEEEQIGILQRSIHELPPRLRMAFVLRIWDELPYDEIVSQFAAAGMQVNVRTVQRYVAEAFERCRRAISQAGSSSCKVSK
jgi:RNA polymerase sigma factor (sigma-70 family)